MQNHNHLKNIYNKAYRETEDSIFDVNFGVAQYEEDLWQKLDNFDQIDQTEIVFQGRLHQKLPKTKKWQSFHFELYSDKLIRIPNKLEAEQQIEFLRINSCYLKKIKQQETSFTNYKFGIRLSKGELKSEIFTESNEIFNKLYDQIKRFCILHKFTKKYKILSKCPPQNDLQNSQTYKCFKFSDSVQYCVQIIDKVTLNNQVRLKIIRITQILRKLDHPQVLKLVEVYEDELNVFIVTELLSGVNFLEIKSPQNLYEDERNVADLMQKLFSGLSHIHKKSIAHKDISVENIHIRNPKVPNDIVFINFSQAEFIEQNRSYITPAPQKKNTIKNMLFYHPDHYIRGCLDNKSDIFSLGIVFYFIIFGVYPLQDMAHLCNTEDFTINYDLQIKGNVKYSQSAFDLLKNMLDKDPQQRKDAFLLFNHAWFINMKSRDDEGKVKYNFYGTPTLQTIEEILENDSCVFAQDTDLEEIVKKCKKSNKESYIHNVIQDGSLIYEDEFEKETIFDKIEQINQIQFLKFPSKNKHDLFFNHIKLKLGVNINEFCTFKKNSNSLINQTFYNQ